MQTAALDEQKFTAFLSRMLDDVGASLTAALVRIGDRLGLYRALDQRGPATPDELAARTSTDERYVREWCSNQAASGYLTYDAASGRFALPPEHAMILARDDSPYNMQGLYEIVQTLLHDEPKVSAAFRDGSGVGWHEHHEQLYGATARFFRPGYEANIAGAWIPALDGMGERLAAGIDVADVGCGHGVSTAIMASAYPRSRFTGFDYHEASLAAARRIAGERGVAERVRFERAGATDFPGTYDFIALFDCVHDMGDPAGALRHVREALRPGGMAMLVEPFAHDRLEENLNPVGRVYYAASTLLCTPSAKAQPGGYALGAQAGEARMRDVAATAGFSGFRRAAETPFNLIYELRP